MAEPWTQNLVAASDESDGPWSKFSDTPVTKPTEPSGGLIASAKQSIGATIKGAGQAAADFIPGVDRDNAVSRYGQSIVDANPTVIHELGDIADKPLTAVAEATGNAAGSMGGILGVRALGMGITAAAPLTGPLAPVTAIVGQAISWLAPAAIASLPSFGSIRDQQILADPANETDAKALAMAALGAGTVGIIESKFGPQQWALSAMTKEGRVALAEKFAKLGAGSLSAGVAKAAALGGAVEGAEELAQNPIEQLASFQDPTTSENIKQTLFGGAMGAIGGGVLGGGFGAVFRTPNTDEAIAAAQDVAFGGATDAATAAIDEFKTGNMGPAGLLGAPSAGPTLIAGEAGVGTPEQQAAFAAQQDAERLAGMTAPADSAPTGLMSSIPIVGQPTITPDTSGGRTDTTGVRADDLLIPDTAQPATEPLVVPQQRVPSDIEAYQAAQQKQARGELLSSYERTILDAGPVATPSKLVTELARGMSAAEIVQRQGDRIPQQPMPVTQRQLAQEEQPGVAITVTGNANGVPVISTQSAEQTSVLTAALKAAGIKPHTVNDGTVRVPKATPLEALQQVIDRVNIQFTPPRGQAQPAPTQGDSNGQGMQGQKAPEEVAVQQVFGTGAQLRTASEAPQPGERVSTMMRTALTQIGRLTGTKVVFVSAEGADGATRSKDGNTVYINVRSSINPLQVMGHEATHVLKRKHKEAWAAIRTAVSAAVDDNSLAEFGRDYWGIASPERAGSIPTGAGLTAWLDQRPDAVGVASSEATVRDFLMDEMISDLGGERWSDPAFWDNVFQNIEAKHGHEQAKTIIQRLVAAIKELIAKFMIVAKRDGFAEFKTEGMIAQRVTPEQLREIQKAIESAYAEFISAERTNEPAGYVRGAATPAPAGATSDEDDELAELEAAQQSPARSEFGSYPKAQVLGKPRSFLPGVVRRDADDKWSFVDKKTGDEYSYPTNAQAKTAMEQMARGVQESTPRLASSVQAADTTGVVVGAKPGAFSWTPQSNTTLWAKWKKGDAYGPLNQGDMPPPFGGPTQRTPNQAIIGEAVFKILKSKGAQAVIKDILSASKVPLTSGQKIEVLPTQGSWLGQPERSFKIVGLTFEQSDVVSKTLGFATAQDMAIVTEPVANPAPDTYVNPGIAIGNGKKFDNAKLKPIIDAAHNEGIDYTVATDGYSVQFGYGPWLPFDESEFIDKVGRIATATGMTSQAYEARTKANFAGSYRDAIERITGLVQGQGNTDAAAGPSDLFTRTVDNILIPYARAVGGQGYRFSPDLFAERFNLGNAEREYIRSALRPKSGYARSTAKIVSESELAGREPKADEELLVVGKSSGTAKKPTSNNSDVFWALQNRAALTGLIEPGDYSAEAQKLIAQAIEDEIAFHVSRPEGKSAIGWYDAALAKAKKIYHQVFPELDTNPDREMLFDALLGITSQGNDVHANSIFSGRMYYLITRENMTIGQAQTALTGTFGEQSKAIENNFLKLEQLLKVNGYNRMRKIFNKQGTVGELNAMLRQDKDLYYKGEPLEITGLAEQTVRGWMVFGPKIGSFINNLHGDYSTLTADLWFSRTWNRILGFSFLHTPAQEAPKYQAFKEALIAEYEKTTDAKKINDKGVRTEWDHGEDLQNVSAFRMDSYLADPDEMLRIATKIEELYRTGIDFNGKKTKGYSTKSDLRRAAKNWIEHRYDAVQLPRVDSERAFQQKVMETAQKFMKKRHGITITIADMQAALWYHEKELFNKFGAGDSKSDPADYEDAAKKFMQKYNDGDLFYVEKPTPRYIRGTQGSYRANAPDTGPQFSERRGRPDATSSRPAGESPTSQSLPRYGRPADRHAVSVTGVHYSREQRPELSSRYFGTGMKGQEGPRVRAATDPRIKRRLYFYANTGRGVQPESDVGIHAHSVGLDNVYDMDVDPLKLYVPQTPDQPYRSVDLRMNDFESAVIDAGYDGYMTREFGTGGAVVLLGDHSVPVQYEGAGARPTTDVTPAPRYSDLQQLRQRIAANRALPSGRLSGLEWKRVMQREMPEVDPRWLDNSEMYYKGDLLKGAEETAPVQFSLVRAAEAKKLDAGKKVTLYRAMTLIDDKLYPPMSAKLTDAQGKLALRDPEPVGQWMRADEQPDLVNDVGMFPLKKPGGGTTWALYAPYFHASPIPLNDQFTAAWKNDGIDRPRLVTVEVEIPESEMTSGYQAEGSSKKTGANKWNSGVVASKVPGGREVVLSRYVKIKRVVPDAEVAKKIAAIVKPNRLSIPENTVTPQLRAELEKQGVRIAPVGTAGDDIRYSEIRAQADAIKAMSEDQRDNLDPYEFGYRGYVLYEAEKMMPKKDGTFKAVNENNSFALWQEADAVVNIDGKPYLATKQEDPDDDADEGLYVWSFSDPETGGAGADIQTDWSDKAEAVVQLREKLGGVVQRSTPRFYSQLARSVSDAPAKMDGQPASQWVAWINGNASKLGVKKEEIQWSGVLDWLGLRGKERTTREDVSGYLEQGGVQVETVVLGAVDPTSKELIAAAQARSYIRSGDMVVDENGDAVEDVEDVSDRRGEYYLVGFLSYGSTKFAQHVPPGSAGGYREVLLTLPVQQNAKDALVRPLADATAAWRAAVEEFGPGKGNEPELRAERMRLAKAFDEASTATKTQFRSNHWTQPNVIAHLRYDTVAGANGDRLMRVVEIQSDFGQSYKKQKDAIQKAVDDDFQGIIDRMEANGVLTVECD